VENEIKFGMPFRKYQEVRAVNVSTLKWMLRSPMHAAYHSIGAGSDEAKPSWQMQTGSAVDTMLLEGIKAFEAQFVISPPWSKNSKDYKKWERSVILGDSQIISEDVALRAAAMVEAAHRKNRITEILRDGRAQVSIFWEDPDLGGLACKGRIDWIDAAGTVWDLKTTGDATWYGFGRNIDRRAYHWQLAWYLRGMSVITGVPHKDAGWLVVENEPPHESIVYRAQSSTLDRGWAEVYAAAEEYSRCLDAGTWPGYPDEVQTI
jgi:hypothetical protein